MYNKQMRDHKTALIQFAIDNDVLRFGEFTLKSGRSSPYFFNLGLFQTGAALAKLGQFYAQTIIQEQLSFDMLFGPAYKGIAIVSSTAIALSEHFHCNVPFAFNRKEAKDHGEGGWLIGAPLSGQVLVLDDVMTMGSTIRSILSHVQSTPQAHICGILTVLDRLERGQGPLSAAEELRQTHGIRVLSIISFHDVIDYLNNQPNTENIIEKMLNYHSIYGVHPPK